VSDTLRVLLLTEADANDPASAAFFVSRALVPSAQSAPGLTLTHRRGADADRGVLETSDAFVLVAPAILSAEAEEIIARRVEDGAQLMVFLDGPISASLAAASFSPPFQLSDIIESDPGAPVFPGSHKLFGEADAGDWNSLHLRHHYQNTVLPGRAAEVALRYGDGAAALTVSPMGRGAVIFANLPLTVDGGDLVGSPMFPALLHELLRTSRNGSNERAGTPGSAWTLDVPTPQEGKLIVSGPDEKPVEVKVVSSGRLTRLALPSARLPGIYRVQQNGILAGAGVVNVDARESDTRSLPLERIKPGTGSAVAEVRSEEDLMLGEKRRPLWPKCAGAVVALGGLEMLLLGLWRSPAAKR
jgi:hypothetical protein